MEGLGINWKILIGQFVNFAILFFLLKRFAFKPFLNILEKRKNRIEEGVKKADEAEKSLQKIRILEGEIRKNGQEKAREILKESEKKAQSQFGEILVAAENERKRIIEDAKSAARKETEVARERQRKEIIERTFFVAEKFLKEKMKKKKDEKFLEEIISGLK